MVFFGPVKSRPKIRKNPIFWSENKKCATFCITGGATGEVRRGPNLSSFGKLDIGSSGIGKSIRHAAAFLTEGPAESASAHSAGPSFYACGSVGLRVCGLKNHPKSSPNLSRISQKST